MYCVRDPEGRVGILFLCM